MVSSCTVYEQQLAPVLNEWLWICCGTDLDSGRSKSSTLLSKLMVLQQGRRLSYKEEPKAAKRGELLVTLAERQCCRCFHYVKRYIFFHHVKYYVAVCIMPCRRLYATQQVLCCLHHVKRCVVDTWLSQ